MTPNNEFYSVTINGTAYPADLNALRQWVMEGRIGPYMPVTRVGRPPMVARETPELRDLFQPPPVAPLPEPPPAYRPPTMPPTMPHAGQSFSGVPMPRPVAPAYHVSAHDGPFPNETHKRHPRYRRAVSRIYWGSIPGLILSGLMVLFGFIAAATLSFPTEKLGGFNPVLIVVGISVLFMALNLGLHFGSRVCAALLFLWMLLALTANLVNGPTIIGILVTSFMGIAYFSAFFGAFDYQAFKYEVETGRI